MKLSILKIKQDKLIVPNSLSALKLIKLKENINEKLFSKMASNSMSPQKQNLIKICLENPVCFNYLYKFYRTLINQIQRNRLKLML
jgi:hypothetical protein